jgi:hypothetical protein
MPKPATQRGCGGGGGGGGCAAFSWWTGSWGSCSGCDGSQSREVRCTCSTDTDDVGPDSSCGGGRPSTTQACGGACPTPPTGEYYWYAICDPPNCQSDCGSFMRWQCAWCEYTGSGLCSHRRDANNSNCTMPTPGPDEEQRRCVLSDELCMQHIDNCRV